MTNDLCCEKYIKSRTKIDLMSLVAAQLWEEEKQVDKSSGILWSDSRFHRQPLLSADETFNYS